MIYIENKDGVQRVVIPTNDTNVEYVNFIPQEGDSDYYTKEQTDEKIAQSRTSVLGEVGDWLSHYPTTDQMHDAIENVTVDLTGYATEDWVEEQGYATKQYVDDAVADIPTGGGVEVNIESLKLGNAAINGLAFDSLFASYSQGIPSYIFDTDTKAIIPVVGAVEDPVNGAGIGSILYVLNKDVLIQYQRTQAMSFPLTKRTNIPLGGSADLSDYYTKEETDDKIDDALLAAPEMLENAGFATQDWVNMNYATMRYVDDAVADIPTGGGTEPFIVEVSSLEPITKTEFDQLFESYSKGIPTYISSNIVWTPRLTPVVGIRGKLDNLVGTKMWVIYDQSLIEYTRSIGVNITYTKIPLGGSADMSDYYTKGEIDTIKDDLQTQITDNKNAISGLDTRVKDIELNGGGSGGASGAKVYVAEWNDITGGYTRVTNQMVYDMFNNYYNDHLLVQLQMNDNIYTVYFAQDENPFYRVYMLAANIMGKLEGNINLPYDDANYEETYFSTDGSGGGSADIDWNNVPYLTVTGGAVFNSEVRFNASGFKDIASGIKCAFKTVKSQSVDQWTRKIHAGTDGDNIYFVSSDEAGNTQLAMIDTEGNIYEGKDKLSDKYATKTYVDEVYNKVNKYEYTITDDIALTGNFSQGEGYELFNDVRDGADVNFKLIMNGGQRKYIPIFIEYDSNVDKANFMFLDYGRYITCTLESNGNMSIGTENFN